MCWSLECDLDCLCFKVWDDLSSGDLDWPLECEGLFFCFDWVTFSSDLPLLLDLSFSFFDARERLCKFKVLSSTLSALPPWFWSSNVLDSETATSLHFSWKPRSEEEKTVSKASLDFKLFRSLSELRSLSSSSALSFCRTKSAWSISSGDFDLDESGRLFCGLEFPCSVERDLDLERDSELDLDLDLDLRFRFLCFFLSLDFDLDECFLCLCFLERFSTLGISTSSLSNFIEEFTSSTFPLSSFMYTDFKTLASSSEIKLMLS